jgi:hypothetical protein
MNRIGKGPARRRRGRAGWLVPLGIFVATAGATGAGLAYLKSTRGFTLFERPAPTDSTVAVAVRVGETGFHIPASYIVYASARRGGRRDELEMMALIPDMQSYSLADAPAFASKAPDSRVLNFTLREERRTLSDQERLEQSYLPLVEDRDGLTGPYALTRYTFRRNSGYDDYDLFVGPTPSAIVILRCEKDSADVPSPNCQSMTNVTDELSLEYRFRRAHLDRWRDIDAGLRALTGAFMDVESKPGEAEPETGDAAGTVRNDSAP